MFFFEFTRLGPRVCSFEVIRCCFFEVTGGPRGAHSTETEKRGKTTKTKKRTQRRECKKQQAPEFPGEMLKYDFKKKRAKTGPPKRDFNMYDSRNKHRSPFLGGCQKWKLLAAMPRFGKSLTNQFSLNLLSWVSLS